MIISGYNCWKRKGLSRRRNNVFRQSIPDPRSGPETLKVRLPTVDNRNIDALPGNWSWQSGMPADRADLLLGRVVQGTVHGAVSCRTSYVSTVILYWMRSGIRSQCRLTRASVMWSERLSWKVSRAPAFNTNCRRRIVLLLVIHSTYIQGWARDVKARDRDAHLPRPRRDVCSSRDVIETLKYKFYWLQ